MQEKTILHAFNVALSFEISCTVHDLIRYIWCKWGYRRELREPREALANRVSEMQLALALYPHGSYIHIQVTRP